MRRLRKLCRRRIFSHIQSRIHCIDVLLIEAFPQQLQSFSKSLEMYHLSLAQEFDDFIYVRIITEPKNVIICCPGFLLRCQILRQIRDGITLDRHGCRRPWEPRCRSRIDSRGVVDKIWCEIAVFYLRIGQFTSELVNNRTDHFQMTQLFCTHIGVKKYTNSEKP